MASNSNAIIIPPPSGPTNGVAEGLHPSRGVVEIPSVWSWLGWLLFLLVLAAAAALFIRWWKRRPRPSAPVIPPLPAHVRAQARLMDALHWIEDPKRFCTEVSGALRDYLEERFSFRAPERTTEEFLDEMQNSPKLSREQKLSLAVFLERCDLVKFARDEPDRNALTEMQQAALRLVQETAPDPVSAAPGDAGSSEGSSASGLPADTSGPSGGGAS